MIVVNRSDGNVTYSLDELRIRRVFTAGEQKDIPEEELEALFQLDGGAALIKNYLLVKDEKWVMEHWDAPIEYFWEAADVEKCLLKDDLELFSETLDFAPEGVIEILKALSWKLPLTDLNKVEVIREKLGFDVQAAVKVMRAEGPANSEPTRKERLRRREA